jgi:predicted HTH transcriptional regulator
MQTLKEMISEGEHQMLDFKFRIDDQRKIARTLVAFANTDGGKLLIGVKDNGKITGINPEEEFHMIQGAAQLYCDPILEFESTVWKEDFRLVLEIKILPSGSVKYKALNDLNEWKYYLRVNDQTIIANKIILKVWNFEKSKVLHSPTFTEIDLTVLKLISEQQPVSLSKIYRNLPQISKNKIDYSVALLLHWKSICFHFKNDLFEYSIFEEKISL